MGYINGVPTKILAISGGRVDIVARNDGAFQFFEQKALKGDATGKWAPGFVSGIYETAAAAEAAARQKFMP
jgi:hypothetical protein